MTAVVVTAGRVRISGPPPAPPGPRPRRDRRPGRDRVRPRSRPLHLVDVVDLVVDLVVEDRADVEAAHHPLRIDALEGSLQPGAGLGRLVGGGHPQRGVALLEAELLGARGDLVRLELVEEDAERAVDRGGGLRARTVADRGLDPLRLRQQPLRLRHGVVTADQHAHRVRLLGAGVRRQGIVGTGDLERRDLVVTVVEQLVVDLGGRGELVERLVDGRVVLPDRASTAARWRSSAVLTASAAARTSAAVGCAASDIEQTLSVPGLCPHNRCDAGIRICRRVRPARGLPQGRHTSADGPCRVRTLGIGPTEPAARRESQGAAAPADHPPGARHVVS